MKDCAIDWVKWDLMMARPVILNARLAALCGALGLAACQPAEPKPAPAPKADAPAVAPRVSDFSQPMTAHGTEPFWALIVDGTHFKLSRPGQPDLIAEAPGAAIQPGRAVWIAKAANGQQLTVTFYLSECSDGMSTLKYPMTVEVALLNETLHGCAAQTAKLPREGG
jgi:uncharacterized membrane protein